MSGPPPRTQGTQARAQALPGLALLPTRSGWAAFRQQKQHQEMRFLSQAVRSPTIDPSVPVKDRIHSI